MGISKQELSSQLAAEHKDLNDSTELVDDPVGDITIDKIPLGLATEVHDHIAC